MNHGNIEWEYCEVPICDCILPSLSVKDQYTGQVNTTYNNKKCAAWNSLSTEIKAKLYGNYSESHNYCRNPGATKTVPWCFTNSMTGQWDACDIPICNCKVSSLGLEYKGNAHKTYNGDICRSWTERTARHPFMFLPLFPDKTLEDAENYCRNPDGDVEGPWCYRSIGSRGTCNVPFCELQTVGTSSNDDSCSSSLSCRSTPKGVEYEGSLSVTIGGHICQRWDTQYPHKHNEIVPSSAQNFCRNPNGKAPFPWCYTTNSSVIFDYCDIDLCGSYSADCRSRTEPYKGRQFVTVSGHICQRWSDQTPHSHDYTSTHMMEGESLEVADNFCRHLGNKQFPWCYTIHPEKEWEFCDIPLCTNISVGVVLIKESDDLVYILAYCLGATLLLLSIVFIILLKKYCCCHRRKKHNLKADYPLLRSAHGAHAQVSMSLSASAPNLVDSSVSFTPRSSKTPSIGPDTTRYYKRRYVPIDSTHPGRNSSPCVPARDLSTVGNGKPPPPQSYLEIIDTDESYLPMDGRNSINEPPEHRVSTKTM